MIKPIENDHPGEWHQQKFVEFARAKFDIGEPTPHMRVITAMSEGWEETERIWLAGCYLAAYSVISGEAIQNSWSWERMNHEPEKLLEWLVENWKGIHTRKPRRCVRTPAKFHRCLVGFAEWLRTEFPRLKAATFTSPQEEYDAWWKSADSIIFFGRYVNIRLLELMRRWGHMDAHLYDIRAIGAHSPIRCLMLLRPDRIEELSTGEAVIVNEIANEVKKDLDEDMSFFLYATILCEYRSCYEDRSDYAGNQHDEELEYSLSRYAEYWKSVGFNSRLYEIRAQIDPHECLGELQGWTKRRTDVASWMRNRGVVWSDLLYDYNESITQDKPVRR